MSFIETSSAASCETKNNEGDEVMTEEDTIVEATPLQTMQTENEEEFAQNMVLEDAMVEVMKTHFCDLETEKEGMDGQCDAIDNKPPEFQKSKRNEDRTTGNMATKQKDVIDEAIESIQEKLRLLQSQQKNSPANQERRRRFQERINIFSSLEAVAAANNVHQNNNHKT